MFAYIGVWKIRKDSTYCSTCDPVEMDGNSFMFGVFAPTLR